ncbi:PhoD-like phosphatase (macronuclear) [Tetrahymena thermophila SB210]|uniref:PhoD-like phosphatase n=1 Tax=Tetrahymena thermophila (strain SB210) TaxID=312017 RepID=W7XKE1_TETTS|nr:PhoD-like phosphatase [Tetrahymena thermophila SB210]EWS74824.1 PhoD-like phosphatase [Tetrahymena thermophila SB210]|eukprot:XP_012652655.1 PhoD-like phosphatase [Tetrahymena thermophila SB210]
MKELIGPVIGKVTDTTARVLLEYDSDGEVTVTLSAQGQTDKILTQRVQARKPAIFRFLNLQSNTKYSVLISPYTKTLKSQFKTLNYEVKDLKICWVSCNDASKYEKLGKRNLWLNLAKEVAEEQYDLIVHMGDQVYLDSDQWYGNKNNVYNRVQEQVFNKYPKEEWKLHNEEVLELIRDEYRRAWNFPQTAYILANTSNIMIFDDHDIRNDWGQYKRKSVVYYEYQRQLRDDSLDLNDLSKVKEEYFTVKLGKIGLFFCELRGDRTWHRQADFDESKIMTQKQWDFLDQSLNQEFQDVENYVFVSQSTVVFLNHKLNEIFGKSSRDYLEQWVRHEDCQIKLLKKLYDWKFDPKFQGREVTIVCGDLHLGGHTDIYFKKKQAFKQFTSSAITNGLKQGRDRILNHLGYTISEIMPQGEFQYDHHGWTGQNNYGASHFRNIVNKKNQKVNSVECWSVIAKDKEESQPFMIQPKIDNYTFTKDIDFAVCCTIF